MRKINHFLSAMGCGTIGLYGFMCDQRRETAFALAKLGATVILGCRNVDAAKQVAQEIRYGGTAASVALMLLRARQLS